MAPISKSLQALLLTLFLVLANKVHSQDDVTTFFSFDSFESNSAELTYQGDAHIPEDTKILRLMKTTASGGPVGRSIGRVLYSHPLHFWESNSSRVALFQTSLVFNIKPSSKGAAEGIAFFIAPVGTTIPDGAGGYNLGIFEENGGSSSLFAVEFDTFVNAVIDPEYRHIGIDINSGKSKEVAKFDSAAGTNVTAHVEYDPITRNITVIAKSGSQTAEFSYVYDLKTVLPEHVQVGISAATGEAEWSGVHDVHSWQFYSIFLHTDASGDGQNEEGHIRQVVSE